MKTKFKSWSYSRYADYELCPLKARLKHLDKIFEPPNAAMERGSMIHKEAEEFMLGRGSEETAPVIFGRFQPLLVKVRKFLRTCKPEGRENVQVEKGWALTKKWGVVEWDDWANAWLRVKIDLFSVQKDPSGRSFVELCDWKTGKFRAENAEAYMEQLELYALAIFAKYPKISRVEGRLMYVDAQVIFPEKDGASLLERRRDFARLKKKWGAKVKAMLHDTEFLPRPNWSCKWCHFRKDNAANGGGQCQY